jgi:hypothetical protein
MTAIATVSAAGVPGPMCGCQSASSGGQRTKSVSSRRSIDEQGGGRRRVQVAAQVPAGVGERVGADAWQKIAGHV